MVLQQRWEIAFQKVKICGDSTELLAEEGRRAAPATGIETDVAHSAAFEISSGLSPREPEVTLCMLAVTSASTHGVCISASHTEIAPKLQFRIAPRSV